MSFIKQTDDLLAQFFKNESGSVSLPRPGDLISGIILEKNSKRVTVDLGSGGLGIVYWSEMQNAREILRSLKPGDELKAKVVQIDNEEGVVELSLAEADKQRFWAEVIELRDKEEVVTVKSVRFNRGGLIAEMNGLQAFLPISQLSPEHYPKVGSEDKNKITEAIQALVGQEFKVRIIDINTRTNKLIISERAATEISMKELVKNYEIGQVVDGIVSGVADFGVFLKFTDNPAVEGLIHVSELEWRQVDNPKEVVKIDDVLKAKIIDIKDGRISLSFKALKTDPWLAAQDKYSEGQTVTAKIYSFNPFGAVVNLDENIQGQIHVTEFGGIEEMKKKLAQGKEYEFVIESIKVPERRITLKLKV